MAGNKKPKRKTGAPRDLMTKLAHAKADRERRIAQKNQRIDKTNNLPLGHPMNAHRIETVFKPLERVLHEQETTGSILFGEDGRPIMRDYDGEWYPLITSVMQMTHLYDVMANDQGWSPQPPGLRAYALKLGAEILIAQQDIDDARATIAWMREHVATLSPVKWTELFHYAGELDRQADERHDAAELAAGRAAA